MITIQPTIVVGLGEAGRRTVAYLKRRIYHAYGPLDSVFLLAVTLPEEGGAAQQASSPLPYELLPKEVIELDLTGAHQGGARLAQEQPWLPAGVLRAGGVDREARAAARLAFMADAETLIPWLYDNVRAILSVRARDAMGDKGFVFGDGNRASVYIIAALEDPVGSGLLLDFAYLVRYTLNTIGVPDVNMTGIIHLPDSSALTERSGANVYAALKELDAHMNGAPFVQRYTPTVQIDSSKPPFANELPFNHGCFLLDTINENGIALGDRDESSAMLGEWLFQASLTSCRQSLDTPIAGASGRRYVEERLAVYGSLGLAGFILPIDGFVDFCANRLSAHLLDKSVVGNVSSQEALEDVGAFLTDQRLTPDSFKANTLKPPGAAPGTQTMALLESASWSQLETRARQVTQQLENEELPAHAQLISARARERGDQMPRVLEQQRNQLLSQPDPNVIPLAVHFFHGLVRQLQGHLNAQQKDQEQSEKRCAAASKELNRRGASLVRALATLPRTPLDFILVGLGAIVAFLVPLWLASRFILGVVEGGLGVLLVVVLTMLSLGSVVAIVWQVRDQIARARINFLDSFRRYADARAAQTAARETTAFYPDLIAVARDRMVELQNLYDRVTALKHEFQRQWADSSHLLGKIDFPFQRSLLTPEFIEAEYVRHTTKPDELFNSFREAVGTPDRWLKEPNQLPEHILAFSRDVFEPLRAHTVDSLLESAPSDIDRKRKVLQHAKELQTKSAPMWSYNKFVVGQELSGSRFNFGLLAMDDPAQSKLDDEFKALDVGLATQATHDPYRMQVMRLSQGFPLYGLRAFDDFRDHYSRMLEAGDQPLHVRDDYLVVEDPMYYPPGLDPHATIDTLFAVGRVAGIIAQQGNMFVVRPEHEEGAGRPLANTVKRSTALLSLRPALAAEVSHRIDAWVTENTSVGAIQQLKAAVVPPRAPATETDVVEPLSPPLEEWERRALLGFEAQLRS